MTQKMLNLYTRIVRDGRLWQITFSFGNKHNIKVTARDLNGRLTYTAPTDANKIMDLFPIEYWPAFAVPLANLPDNSNHDIQERLF